MLNESGVNNVSTKRGEKNLVRRNADSVCPVAASSICDMIGKKQAVMSSEVPARLFVHGC